MRNLNLRLSPCLLAKTKLALQRFYGQSWLYVLIQCVIIAAVWYCAEILVELLHLPLSSGVLGMFLMLILLMNGAIKVSWVRLGAKFVLGELVLMFIPLMMSIIQYKALFVSKGWQLMLTIILSTAMVMLSSALTFIMAHRLQRRFYRHQIHKAQLNLKNDDNV
ncbi:CidA/LrgA family protein [Psychrobacter sanguinis]|uniref:CidA/LrgA family protein n=1 Tax=Psychrobacter sanguinis TaxID=861445 RepID=UPI001917DB56|nr:CidA/LrgA family protein [Psychrobacter sanguinis]MCC3344540.1 CidA/LrgA family protein [Psychrobacter sanguinis]